MYYYMKVMTEDFCCRSLIHSLWSDGSKNSRIRRIWVFSEIINVTEVAPGNVKYAALVTGGYVADHGAEKLTGTVHRSATLPPVLVSVSQSCSLFFRT